MGLKIAAQGHSGLASKDAVGRLATDVAAELNGKADLVITFFTEQFDNSTIMTALQEEFPDTALLGCSSCRGAVTSAGLHGIDKPGVAVWAISDPEGTYGTGICAIDSDVATATCQALDQALAQASRQGEMPDLVWLHVTPGYEEQAIKTIDEQFSGNVPIVGGSPADEAIAGNWSCFAGQDAIGCGVALAVLFPSGRIAYSFQSGYGPTDHEGVVTASQGRKLMEIDGRPAAEVYNEWTGGAVRDALEAGGGNVLASTTLFPLSMRVGFIAGHDSKQIPYYVLLHPDTVGEDGSLSLFAEPCTGEAIRMMSGTSNSLVMRAGGVPRDAMLQGDFDAHEIVGGLMIFCAGCMLTVGDRLVDASDQMAAAFGGKPFAGGFTFGEQGCFVGGENRHGNLMVSSVVFAE